MLNSPHTAVMLNLFQHGEVKVLPQRMLGSQDYFAPDPSIRWGYYIVLIQHLLKSEAQNV